MRLPFALAAIVCAAIVAGWAWLGHPVPAPSSPLAAGEKLPCVSYAPFRPGQSPFIEGLVIPPEQIDDDFARLAKITRCVRTYSTEMGLHVVPELARKHGLKVLQGMWIGRDEAKNRVEIDAAVKAAQDNPDVIEAVIVGNEVLLRGEQSPTAMAALIREVKSKVPVPVTYADVWEFWERNSDLAREVDFVTVHILPFWEDLPVSAEDSVAHLGEIREHVGRVFAGKDILIGETGWPSQGRMREGALPSPSNQARVIQELLALAKAKNYRLNVIEAFDQPWKR
ncbi:MAG TPA: beta-1,6-glucan synthase, partial [Ancylobacter sp.]